jgi:outer membrane protein assembly factor BamA
MFSLVSRQTYVPAGILWTLVGMCQCLHGQSLMCPRSSPDSQQETKVAIVDVEFSGANSLSQETRSGMIERIKKLRLRQPQGGDESDWLGQVETEIQETVQKQGYFQTTLTSRSYLIQSEAHELRYIVRVEIDSGPQYRLDQLKFSGATVFTAKELREQFSLHQGDIFDVLEIRNGMDSLSRLYSRLGFIDMVPEPETNIDVKNKQISIVMKIDEGQQYHIEAIEVYGLSATVQQTIKSQVTQGEVFNSKSIEGIVERYKSELPSNVSTDDVISIRPDGTTATVDVVLDFRPCPTT